MIKLSDIQRFPSAFSNRNQMISSLPITIKNISRGNDGILIFADINNHVTIIHIIDTLIKNNSPIRVTCDCESFKYEFSTLISKQNSLINPNDFKVEKLPTKSNKYNVMSGCKHIIALGQYINNNKNKI